MSLDTNIPPLKRSKDINTSSEGHNECLDSTYDDSCASVLIYFLS